MLSNKQQVLDAIKKEYENFYNQNAAKNPKKVEKIKYFIEWLKDSATIEDIDIKEFPFFIRPCEMKVKIKIFYPGPNVYDNDMFNTTMCLVSDAQLAEKLKSKFNDVYYSSEANSKVVPADLKKLAKAAAEVTFNEWTHEQCIKATFFSCSLQEYLLDDPIEDKYFSCTIRYPHPIADDKGNKIRSFDFYVWKDSFIKSNYNSKPDDANSTVSSNSKGGCYVATCVYGSYDCPQVWTLRRYRDNTLGSTWYGRTFIRTYYAISPTLVKWFGHTKWFKKMWKNKLDCIVKKLQDNGVENTPYDDKNW